MNSDEVKDDDVFDAQVYLARCEAFRERVYSADPSARYRQTDSFMRYPGPGNRAERRALAAQARKTAR